VAGGADAGVEEGLIGIDITDAMEQRLVKQRGLDGRLAIAEEDDEVFEWNSERLGARAFVLRVGRDDREPPEAPGVDEAQLLAAAEGEDGVGVWRDRSIWSGDEQAASHSEVDEELRALLFAAQIDDDGLANAVNALDAAACEDLDDLIGSGLEGLRLVTGPHRADGLAVDAGVDAVGYRFDFGELGHGFLKVYGRAWAGRRVLHRRN